MEQQGEEAADIKSRGPELGVAAFLMLLAGLVLYDSLRVGIGWADDGPKSGYFPFYIGLILLGAAGSVFVGELVRLKRSSPSFAEIGQLKSVWAIFWPMLVYVGLIGLLGIYVSSLVLIAWFMWRHGKYRWIVTLPVAVGVPVVFFLVFERWFLVPLPKGPLERLLGF